MWTLSKLNELSRFKHPSWKLPHEKRLCNPTSLTEALTFQVTSEHSFHTLPSTCTQIAPNDHSYGSAQIYLCLVLHNIYHHFDIIVVLTSTFKYWQTTNLWARLREVTSTVTTPTSRNLLSIPCRYRFIITNVSQKRVSKSICHAVHKNKLWDPDSSVIKVLSRCLSRRPRLS